MHEKKILMIVDDDRDDRFFFRKAVKMVDPAYECREAHNGADALQQLRKERQLPDFIFLDLNMPIMDGRECLAELKKDARLRTIPVIIYTTSAFEKDREITRKLGAVHYLVKPADVSAPPGEIIGAMERAEKFVSN